MFLICTLILAYVGVWQNHDDLGQIKEQAALEPQAHCAVHTEPVARVQIEAPRVLPDSLRRTLVDYRGHDEFNQQTPERESNGAPVVFRAQQSVGGTRRAPHGYESRPRSVVLFRRESEINFESASGCIFCAKSA